MYNVQCICYIDTIFHSNDYVIKYYLCRLNAAALKKVQNSVLVTNETSPVGGKTLKLVI